MVKKVYITEPDRIYYQAVERFRRACNWSRSDLIFNIASLGTEIIDEDMETYQHLLTKGKLTRADMDNHVELLTKSNIG